MKFKTKEITVAIRRKDWGTIVSKDFLKSIKNLEIIYSDGSVLYLDNISKNNYNLIGALECLENVVKNGNFIRVLFTFSDGCSECIYANTNKVTTLSDFDIINNLGDVYSLIIDNSVVDFIMYQTTDGRFVFSFSELDNFAIRDLEEAKKCLEAFIGSTENSSGTLVGKVDVVTLNGGYYSTTIGLTCGNADVWWLD